MNNKKRLAGCIILGVSALFAYWIRKAFRENPTVFIEASLYALGYAAIAMLLMWASIQFLKK